MAVPMSDCVLGHVEPVEAFIGYACRRHFHWINDTLREIETLSALLDDVLIPGPGGDTRSGTRVGSPAPGSVAVMALTDSRAKTPIDLDSDDDVPDMPGTLGSWARMVVEERDTTDQLTGDVTQSVRVLRRERAWIAQQPWIDDYVFELAVVHRALARAVGDSMWPRPIGKCPNDQASLYNTIGLDEVHCRRCGATWAGVHLARLRLIFEQQEAAK
jgi:hypothetical protein